MRNKWGGSSWSQVNIWGDDCWLLTAECQGEVQREEMHAEVQLSHLAWSWVRYRQSITDYLLLSDNFLSSQPWYSSQSRSRLTMSGMNNGILSDLIFINIPRLTQMSVWLDVCREGVNPVCPQLSIYKSISFQERAESNNNQNLGREKKAAVR